jgi:RNA polymerase sigma factor (sigma-70 family)
MSGRELTPMDRWPDDKLLHAAHKGDKRAFEIFCVRSLPALVRYLESQCVTRGIPKDLARDFAQETVTKALDQVRLYRVAGQRPLPKVSAAWLNQIGFNLIMDWLRGRSREEKAKRALGKIKPRRPSRQEVEQQDEVYKFYTWLSPAEQEMIELVLVEGLHPQEAGERLGLSPPAAYKRYERAVLHLQDLIREHGSSSVRYLAGNPVSEEDNEEE